MKKDEIRVTILGSGTGVPSGHRASPGYLIRIADNILLMDVGPGTLRQLARLGIDHSLLDAVLITHFHPDHTADLIHFLFATRHPPCLKIRRPFTLVGPVGFSDFLHHLKAAYGNWLNIPEKIMKIHEIEPRKNFPLFPYLTILSCTTRHTRESIAFGMQTSGRKKLVYSGDTGPCDELVSISKGADLLILESSFPEGESIEGHLTPSQAGMLATRAQAKKLLLTHFYPECLASDIASQCRKYFGGELIIGSDLLEVKI